MNEQGHGYLLINKKAGETSHNCVAKVRRLVGREVKVGHAGTLDPFASGLLVIGVGRAATRTLGIVSKNSKVYVATGKLGELTSTLDTESQVVETRDATGVTAQKIEHAIVALGSSYEQIPPIYSALKYQGKPLYHFARSGKKSTQELEQIAGTKRRTVQLYSLELTTFDAPFFSIEASVSPGTYIRTLIDDIARGCDTCATMHRLTRTSIGDFTLSRAITTADLQENWADPGSWEGNPFFMPLESEST